MSFRHPADAIRAGLVYVAADRAEALLMQRSVRENIALPFTTRLRALGPDRPARRGRGRSTRPSRRLQIDTRAGGEVRRLSGGNQQKVTIARWVAGGVHTMLCFDPTRGIDIRTKHQIYVLLRELAEAGAAVLLYTSELKEIQLVCDRAIVIFGGRVVAEIGVADADEPTLLRAAYNLQVGRADARGGGRRGRRRGRRSRRARGVRRRRAGPAPRATDERRVRHDRHRARPSGGGDRRVGPAQRVDPRPARVRSSSCSCSPRLIQPSYGAPGVQGLAISVLPLALAAVAQAIVVIVRRDRPVDRLDDGAHQRHRGRPHAGPVEEFGVVVVIGVLLLGLVLGAINGSLIVVTRVPDIVVTLAMSFVWAGLRAARAPDARAAARRSGCTSLVLGSLGNEWIPKAAVVLLVIVAVIWIPLRRSRLGLSLYAIGSNRLAAFRSGVPSAGRKVARLRPDRACSPRSAACRLTASTGIGTPVPGPYTLLSVAAVVLGGVSLAGGRGGVFGPIVAVFILQLIRTDMTFLNVEPQPRHRRSRA